MELELKFCDVYCSTSDFIINNIEADSEDFGEQYDTEIYPEDFFIEEYELDAFDYCCKNMLFEPIPAGIGILEKYKITINEYNEICEKLKKGLSLGFCCHCE